MFPMSRSEHYQAGRAEGERWADEDVRSRRDVISHVSALMREEATLALTMRDLSPSHANEAAFLLGRARGYRVNSKK